MITVQGLITLEGMWETWSGRPYNLVHDKIETSAWDEAIRMHGDKSAAGHQIYITLTSNYSKVLGDVKTLAKTPTGIKVVGELGEEGEAFLEALADANGMTMAQAKTGGVFNIGAQAMETTRDAESGIRSILKMRINHIYYDQDLNKAVPEFTP